MENYNNQGNQINTKNASSAGNRKRYEKTFVQRNKYRIRQICGILVLIAVVSVCVVLLTKCGSSIQQADSAVTANATTSFSVSQQSAQQTTQDTVSQTVPSESTSTQQTSEQVAASSEQTTTSEQQTTASKATTSNTTTASQSQTSQTTASPPSAQPNIEVRNGITYVNGILIANKTYPLPADYNPGLDPDALAAFNKMQQAAALEGINLWICSGFRSYSYQQLLYNNYVYRDGKERADRYSARAGHSEHQSGLAMDINYASSYFDNTPEAKWLAAHCSDYGFIIRYKAEKESSTGYMAESWHIRYLGDISLCKSIEASGLSLEEYLGITSVYADP